MANPQKDGITALPDEILTTIFTIVETNAGRPYERMLSLASICRRFRDVIFNHANFWNDITNVLHPNLVKLALARSKDAGLKVSLYGVNEDFTEDSATILEIIRTQAERITSLTFFLSSNDNIRYGTWSSITDLLTTFIDADFLRLEEFKLLPPPPDSDDEDEEDEEEEDEEDRLAHDDDLYHIYTQWNAPSLKRLRLFELVPRLAAGLRLTSLDLTFDTS